MKKFYIFCSTVLVAIAVALTYYYFEYAIHHSITYIWDTTLKTDTHRVLVIPVCIVISLIFFGIQHYLDPQSEEQESHGLGEAPGPTITNFAKVLFIGFFSLVAGASLGPEAILVPASLIIGGYAGVKLFKQDKEIVKLLSMVGFVALFAAFFNSFIAGMLGLILITKQLKIKLDSDLLIIAAIASLVTVGALKVLGGSAYTKLPETAWHISVSGIIAMILLVAAGYIYTNLLGATDKALTSVHQRLEGKNWWTRALAAAGGLSILYLLGGTLVEFTGNESIQPMLKQSASLGAIGLFWILLVKIAAISWSKRLGYRGGLVFPSVFVAAVLVAIIQLFIKDIGFTIGLVAAMVGILAAEAKVKVLF